MIYSTLFSRIRQCFISCRYCLVLLSSFSFMPLYLQESLVFEPSTAFEVYNPSRQYNKIKALLLIVTPHQDPSPFAHILSSDLEFSDQLDIEVKRNKESLNQETLRKLFKQQRVALYIEALEQNKNLKKGECRYQIRLKDPSSGSVLFDKEYRFPKQHIVYNTHSIADDLIPILTGSKGPALSTLLYCKQLSPRRKVICMADYACKLEKIIIKSPTINVAPCWHSKAPVVFYSQFTRSNSRLMSLDLRSKHNKVVCSYDGLNMQPSFSSDGSRAALCLSGKGNSELYLYDQTLCNKLGKRVFKPLTNNGGNNVSPCYLPNETIVFCSDFQTGFPQIYHLNRTTNITRRLTSGKGYCAAPSYCSANNSIVYTRYVNKVFQLFSLYLGDAHMRERQLTFTAGDKVEPSWSECGKYVAFAYTFHDQATKKNCSQIAVLNTASGKIRVLTKDNYPKSFPAWTGRTLYNM